jgi:hypothetical protein
MLLRALQTIAPQCGMVKNGVKPSIMFNDAISEALERLRGFAATEPNEKKLGSLVIEINTILDILDSRLKDKDTRH